MSRCNMLLAALGALWLPICGAIEKTLTYLPTYIVIYLLAVRDLLTVLATVDETFLDEFGYAVCYTERPALPTVQYRKA